LNDPLIHNGQDSEMPLQLLSRIILSTYLRAEPYRWVPVLKRFANG